MLGYRENNTDTLIILYIYCSSTAAMFTCIFQKKELQETPLYLPRMSVSSSMRTFTLPFTTQY